MPAASYVAFAGIRMRIQKICQYENDMPGVWNEA